MAAAVAAPPPGCVEGAAAWRFRRGSSLSHACAFLWGGGPGSAKATAWRRVKGSTPHKDGVGHVGCTLFPDLRLVESTSPYPTMN